MNSLPDIVEVVKAMNRELQRIFEWMCVNRLIPNPKMNTEEKVVINGEETC